MNVYWDIFFWGGGVNSLEYSFKIFRYIYYNKTESHDAYKFMIPQLTKLNV